MIANMALNDAMILSYDANLGRMEFSERDKSLGGGAAARTQITTSLCPALPEIDGAAPTVPTANQIRTYDGAVHQAQAALRCARQAGYPSKWVDPCPTIDACAPRCSTPCSI